MTESLSGPCAPRAGAFNRRLHGRSFSLVIMRAGKPLLLSRFIARFADQTVAALFVFARDTELVKRKARSRDRCQVFRRLLRKYCGVEISALRQRRQFQHVDAIHRAWRKT